MPDTQKSLEAQNYEQFAERYVEAVETKAYTACYERPATLSLLPDVQGLRVLDAGCGTGIYTEWLLKSGAQVIACDVAPQMLELTRRRIHHSLPESDHQLKTYLADLTQPLMFAVDNSFDLVLCPLVLHYLADWQPIFKEFFRVLQPGGIFVFSCGHPTGGFFHTQRKPAIPGNYFDIEQAVMELSGLGESCLVITTYRRPLHKMLNPLIHAGFILDEILEPRPIAQFQNTDSEDYDNLIQEPQILCVRVYKPPAFSN
jgi:SAM-dependent methyltransferase